jgi:hypothetical protein
MTSLSVTMRNTEANVAQKNYHILAYFYTDM